MCLGKALWRGAPNGKEPLLKSGARKGLQVQVLSPPHMKNVIPGKGNLSGKGVYAKRNFKAGEVVIEYHLIVLTEEKFQQLSESEKMFTHTHFGQHYLYAEPERYVNHSSHPNTYQDLKKKCDIALRDIGKGEMITTDATKDDEYM